MVLLCPSTVDHVKFCSHFLDLRSKTIKDIHEISVRCKELASTANACVDSAMTQDTGDLEKFTYSANRTDDVHNPAVTQTLQITGTKLHLHIKNVRNSVKYISLDSYTTILDVDRNKDVWMCSEDNLIVLPFRVIIEMKQVTNDAAVNTIALYCLVHAIVPERTAQLRASRHMTVNAMQNLQDALHHLRQNNLTREHSVGSHVATDRSSQYVVLAEFRRRLLLTLGDVKCNIERSVSTANQSRPHYTVSLTRMAILMPLLKTYARFNLYRRCPEVPTFWGYNSSALVNGCWTTHDRTSIRARDRGKNIPYVYVACLHLYYLLFNGPEYNNVPLTQSDRLLLPEVLAAVNGSREILAYWDTTYCNTNGFVASDLVKYFVDAAETQAAARELECNYMALSYNNTGAPRQNTFTPYCTNGNIYTVLVAGDADDCSYTITADKVIFSNKKVPALLTMLKAAVAAIATEFDAELVHVGIDPTLCDVYCKYLLDTSPAENFNGTRSLLLKRKLLLQQLASLLVRHSCTALNLKDCIAILWATNTMWYHFGDETTEYETNPRELLVNPNQQVVGTCTRVYEAVLARVKLDADETPLAFFNRISSCHVLSDSYWTPFGLDGLVYRISGGGTDASLESMDWFNTRCLFNTCLTTRIALVDEVALNTFTANVLASAFQSDSATADLPVVDTDAILRTAASTYMTPHKPVTQRRSYCTVEAWPQSITVDAAGATADVFKPLFWNNYRCSDSALEAA